MGLVTAADAAATREIALVVDTETVGVAANALRVSVDGLHVLGERVLGTDPHQVLKCGGVPVKGLSAVLQPLGDDAIVPAMRHLNHQLVRDEGRVNIRDAQRAAALGVEGGDHVGAAGGSRALLHPDDAQARLGGGSKRRDT